MMEKTGRVMICCVALLLVLTSVSAVQRDLDSIDDLKKINFGQSVPKHSLVLLYWFANTVDIDNNVIWLTFDPNSRDYGSHHYRNSERLLDPLPQGNVHQDYTIGNLYQQTSMPLPDYVVRPPATEYEGSNRDRIIIRVREQNTGRRALQSIDQVYITQHIEHRSDYDPDHTYRITTNLLRQIRELSAGENQQQLLQLRNNFGSNADDFQLRHIRNTWGGLAGLGLLLYIVIQEKSSSNQRNNQHDKRQKLRDNDASKSNVSRDFRNQDYVLVNVDEDHEANGTTGNRESGIDSVAQTMRKFCCILICLTIILCFIYIFYV
ncbi:uncharacterized protein LOC142944912 [Anarhichas minor]|uniref:uncharacterized protein LOC142944912 n=1 Tax=Anarhichas minor TaxID=65739 RepID=UPI003F731A32